MKASTIGLLIAMTVLCFGPCYAATWIVDPGGGGDALTINEGIALAAVGDTVLVKPSTYFENVVMGDGVALVSELGWGATIIEPAVDSLPIVTCLNLPNKATIEGFTIRGGHAQVGAGLYCENVLPNVIACRLTDNRAIDGAGMACIGCGGGLVAGNTFDLNYAYDRGGGVFCDRSTLSFENNTFTGCEGYYGAACCGVYSSNLTFTGDEFSDNKSYKWGGGISVLYACTIEVTDCTFDKNSASGGGGCAVCWNACRMDVVGCSFTEGYSMHGGGVEASNYSEARVEGNTFTGCRAEYGGAGFNFHRSRMDFIDNDFNHNTSTKWGGAICFRDTSSGTVQNNRIYHNTAIGGGA
jgi:hypothetical protein